MSETAVEPKPKRRPGRPKGSSKVKKLEAELRELRHRLEGQAPPPAEKPRQTAADESGATIEDDPFAEPTRDQVAAQEAAATPGAAPPPQPAGVANRVPLGPERAAMLFGVVCQIYNGTSPALAQRMLAGTLATLPSDQHKTVLEAATVIAQLSETDMAVLGPVLIPRLAVLLVPPSFDLWLALGFVFGSKLVSLQMLRVNPDQAPALLEASKQAAAAAAAILEAGKAAAAASSPAEGA